MDPNPSLRLGFIAEQVNTLTPELVAKDKDGLPESVDYAKLTPILTKAIQELDAKIATLNLSGGSAIPGSLTLKNLSSSLGTWSIDEEGTLTAVRVVTEEVVAKSIKTQAIRSQKGYTIPDEDTGKEYCIKVKSGMLVTLKGGCDSTSLTTSGSESVSSSTPTLESTPTPNSAPELVLTPAVSEPTQESTPSSPVPMPTSPSPETPPKTASSTTP